jgi:Sigma-70, region 4
VDRSETASGNSETPEQKLQAVVGHLSRAVESSAWAGSKHEPLGRVLVFRSAAQSLHVVGDSAMAAEFRRLVTAGAVPGWDLHPVMAGRTPLHVLVGPLHRLSGSNRFYNLLEREGFGYVEEVAVTPEGCLLEFRNSGPRFIAAVRQVIADLGFGGAEARTDRLLAPGDPGPAAAGPGPPAGLPADAAGALQIAAAWAVAEQGAQELGDLLTLAPGVGDLPPDVARSWDRIRRLSLQMLAGAVLADGDLPRLAQELVDELEERRRLILISRTFAQTRRTYDSLAAELGVGRERVRQLEASALQQLAGAAAHDRYRPLRWRAASAAQPDRVHAAVIPGAPSWLGNLLSWLAGRPA